MINGLKAKTVKKRTVGFFKLNKYLNSLGSRKKVEILNILNIALKNDPQLRKLKMYTLAIAFEEGEEQGIEALNLELNDVLIKTC